MAQVYVIGNYLYRWILFAVCFNAVRSQCSGSSLILTAAPELAKFTSPGYPDSYANNLTCQWLIDSGIDGQRVLIYSEHYYINCTDAINIYDGNTTSDIQLANNLCGAGWFRRYSSSDRYILITFTTGDSQGGQGLQFTYLSTPDTSGTGCTAEYALAASTTPQYLTSPGFPSLYENFMTCSWVITAPGPSYIIELELTYTDIEFRYDCFYDKLTVYHGSNINASQVMFTDCTNQMSADDTPAIYYSTTNNVLILFSTDGSVTLRGFIVKYTAYIKTTTTAVPTTTTTTVPPTTTNMTTLAPTTTNMTTLLLSIINMTTFPSTTTNMTTLPPTTINMTTLPPTTTNITTLPPSTTNMTTNAHTATNMTTLAPTTTDMTTVPPTTTDMASVTPTTTNTTTLAPVNTTSASVTVGSTSNKTEAEVNIPLMVASAVGGACFVLLVIGAVWMVKMLKNKKRSKKGSIRVIPSPLSRPI